MPDAAILLAAGRGTRMRGTVEDKVLAPLAGRPAIFYSIRAFVESKAVTQLVFVCRDESQHALIWDCIRLAGAENFEVRFTLGGAERQDSVLNGLNALSAQTRCVFIHDCARPYLQEESVRQLLEAVRLDGAAVLAHRVTDTIKQLSEPVEPPRRCQLRDLNRATLWGMETPQAFEWVLIREAYLRVKREGLRVTDDAAAAAVCGHPVTLVENTRPNPKLTVPDDFAYLEFLFSRENAAAR